MKLKHFFLSLNGALFLLFGSLSITGFATAGLTQTDATHRFQQISDISYRIDIGLSATKPDFEASVGIDFNYLAQTTPLKTLTLDFTGGKIASLVVNGESLSPPTLAIPLRYLKPGANHIQIQYSHPYSRTGSGLYRFTDPEDGRTYLYTDFEPYSANEMFPCFDQPDLKARFALAVDAPQDWSIISNTMPEKTETLPGQHKRWIFSHARPSPLMSTYVFALHAGPFQVWNSEWKSSPGKSPHKIPLRIFARQSLAKYVNAEAWFNTTRKGFDFYQPYFGTPYPYEKYDQLLVPDFNSGAMENIAAVTFSERYITRGIPSPIEIKKLDSTILHEMAHMWFGNLVTLKWWNDLWLNESFATYLENRVTQSWDFFFSNMKQWAYWEDQLSTTHGIQTPVPNTDSAFTQFDGITYGKGASILKLLAHRVGEDTFQKGVQLFIQKNSNNNATLKDFVSSISNAAGSDQSQWMNRWLSTPGMNQLKASWKCDKNRVSLFTLAQSRVNGSSVFRPHTTDVALFNFEGKALTLTRSEKISFENGNYPIKSFEGERCPDFVNLNSGDFGYFRTALDSKSLDTALHHAQAFKEGLDRLMVLETLWDHVLQGELTVQSYIDTALALLPNETHPLILFKTVGHLKGTLQLGLSALDLIPSETEALKTQTLLSDFFWNILQRDSLSNAAPDRLQLWFDAWILLAHSAEHLDRIPGLLSQKNIIKGFVLDSDRRWAAILRLSESGDPRAPQLIAQESRLDASDRGHNFFLAAKAISPNDAEKKVTLKQVFDPNSQKSLKELKSIGEALFPREQLEFLKNNFDTILEGFKSLSAQTSPEKAKTLVRALSPRLCTSESIQKLNHFLTTSKELHPVVKKLLLKSLDDDRRCFKIRKIRSRMTVK